jgi:hypothetical protein
MADNRDRGRGADKARPKGVRSRGLDDQSAQWMANIYDEGNAQGNGPRPPGPPHNGPLPGRIPNLFELGKGGDQPLPPNIRAWLREILQRGTQTSPGALYSLTPIEAMFFGANGERLIEYYPNAPTSGQTPAPPPPPESNQASSNQDSAASRVSLSTSSALPPILIPGPGQGTHQQNVQHGSAEGGGARQLPINELAGPLHSLNNLVENIVAGQNLPPMVPAITRFGLELPIRQVVTTPPTTTHTTTSTTHITPTTTKGGASTTTPPITHTTTTTVTSQHTTTPQHTVTPPTSTTSAHTAGVTPPIPIPGPGPSPPPTPHLGEAPKLIERGGETATGYPFGRPIAQPARSLGSSIRQLPTLSPALPSENLAGGRRMRAKLAIKMAKTKI